MKISLIGMSNTGKSHWSERLHAAGFAKFCCDDLIENKLEPELKKLGYSGIEDVGKWMGQPYDPQYESTSQRYLDLEREVMLEVIAAIENTPRDQNMVVDTTGSVIYTGDSILRKIGTMTTLVYLDAPESVQAELYRNYHANPKPVIWGNSFAKLEGESDSAALKRCYPLLLKSRAALYEPLANVTLDYSALHKPGMDVGGFMELISPSQLSFA